MKKEIEQKRGITLIALIITIIILLILVGVSVNLLIKGDLFGSAEKAVNGTNAKVEEQQTRVDELMGELDEIEKEIEEQQRQQEEAEKQKNLPGTRVTENTKYIRDGKTAWIPAGFTVSGIKNEQSIDNGLVIYDIPEVDLEKKEENFWEISTTVGTETYPKVQCDYNQFVWVPVETPYVTKAELDKIINDSNGSIITEQAALQSLVDQGKYPMSVQLENKTDYRGVLYSFSEGTNKVNVMVKEFSTTDDYSDDSITYDREPTQLNSAKTNQTEEPKLDLQTEYNTIVKSIKEQKGFWVARFELSHSIVGSTNKAESKRGKTVSTADSSSLKKWYGLYSTCKNVNLQSGTEIQSSMIYGSQWDQIMIWMKDVKNIKNNSNFYILDSSYMGNYNTSSGGTGKVQVSGYKNDYAVKQIFDLGGNLFDWTIEANEINGRFLRGRHDELGYDIPASGRLGYNPDAAYDNATARFILYMSL